MRASVLLSVLLLGAPLVAQLVPGSVLGQHKISETAGGFTGELDDYDQFGISVLRLGDVDGDGLPDALAGALLDADGGDFTGAVYVLFLEADGAVKGQQKISALQGSFAGPLDPGDLFGWSSADLGDLDGDGRAEIAVGGWLDDDGGPELGAVWVLNLAANGHVASQRKISMAQGGFTGPLDYGDRFGTSLSRLGDLDGDGVTELAAGALYDDDGDVNCGAVWVLFLNPDASVKAQQKISATTGGLAGPLEDGDRFGYASAPLGDLDQDGVPDLAVSAILDDDGAPNAGAVYILFLRPDGRVKAEAKISATSGGFLGGLDVEDGFGRSLAAVGDLDGDGVPDLAVGAPGHATGAGELWLLFLRPDGSVKGWHRIAANDGGFVGGLSDYDLFGMSAGWMGDADGDGLGTLAVGVIGDDDGGQDHGALWLLDVAGPTWTGLGHGLAGALGVPQLAGQGPLLAGQLLELALTGAAGNAQGSLVVGLDVLYAPFKGGQLVPSPLLVLPVVLTDGAGAWSLVTPWPAGLPPLQIYFQAWIADAGAPAGFAASTALMGLSP